MKGYGPIHKRMIDGSTHLSTKPNLYAPTPESLKQGTLKDRTEVRIDNRTTIFVRKGHDIDHAKELYTNIMYEFRHPEHKFHSGKNKER